MSNKVKDISAKNTHTAFSMILSSLKILIQIILKQMQSHTKIFFFIHWNVMIKDLKLCKSFIPYYQQSE